MGKRPGDLSALGPRLAEYFWISAGTESGSCEYGQIGLKFADSVWTTAQIEWLSRARALADWKQRRCLRGTKEQLRDTHFARATASR